MATTKIPWTNKTWNVVLGCKKITDGCKHCYALRMAIRLAGIAKTAEDYKQVINENEWSGKAIIRKHMMDQPRKWQKPYMIFVCAMNDLFFERVPFNWIQSIFSVMARQDHHTYQVLTKRPERALQFFKFMNGSLSGLPYIIKNNIWFGVTVENENEKYRIDLVKKIPAFIRYLSIEPMLSEINISKQLKDGKIKWVIIGSETGPGKRSLKIEWVHSLINQCRENGVPVFIKKLIIDNIEYQFEDLPKELQIREYPSVVEDLVDPLSSDQDDPRTYGLNNGSKQY